MSPRSSCRQNSQKGVSLEKDPDPLSLAVVILEAVAPIGVLLHEVGKRGRVRRWTVRRDLFRVHQTLKDVKSSVDALDFFLEGNEQQDKPFELGRAALKGAKKDFEQIFTTCHKAGKTLRQAVGRLYRSLDDEDDLQIQMSAGRIRAQFNAAMRSENHGQFIQSSYELLAGIERLIVTLSKKYGYTPTL